MSDLPDEITAKCPKCQGTIKVPLMTHATEQCKRTCRKCGQRWSMLTVPTAVVPGKIAVHTVSFFKLPPAAKGSRK